MEGKIIAEISIIISILFILGLGYLFSKGRGGSILSGYNTMSDEDRKKIDEKALLKFTGKVMYTLSVPMFAILWSIISSEQIYYYIGFIFSIGLAIYTVIYSNSHFKK